MVQLSAHIPSHGTLNFNYLEWVLVLELCHIVYTLGIFHVRHFCFERAVVVVALEQVPTELLRKLLNLVKLD